MSSTDSDAPAPTPAAAPEKKKRQGREADAAVIVEGMTALFRGALVGLLNEDAVEAALTAAQKHPAYKKMLSEVAAGGKLGGKKGKGKAKGAAGSGPKTIRSAYNAFATVAMAHLKASGKPELATISTVGTTWKKLPAHVKTRMEERLNLLKDRFNAAIAAGGEVKPLMEQLKDMERERGLEAIDFTHYISKYHGAPAPEATPAKAPNGPAATPATGDKRKGEGEGHHHKDKKEKKKHKKDKKEKEKKKVSDSDSD
ncbi:hypothetical protein Rsub_04598 [Raphidocelis subcapitata]|uniref:Uncharacterized protein n=1 Tax=Raphidocelis subcapitata TaxID=307507 RepID=A0A2V0NXZ3_9CHLO|nr:hypothetical protein Rsub_04598 [Raphidocelis subcapitata]|eukprot:GBF92494.1 hypothetical protein Rsub_04598 [Raphidocelis subcapitata]